MNELFLEFFESDNVKKLSVTVDVTSNCQLNCIYCYFGQKSRQQFDAEKSLRALSGLLNIFKGKANELSIHFMGGEPLLNWTGITSYLKKARQIAEGLNFNVDWSVTSNLIALTEKRTEYIKENGGRIHCSIDGHWDIQNHNRPHKRQGYCYRKNLEHGVMNALTVPRSDFARVTVSPFSAHHLTTVTQYLWKRGFKKIGLYPAVNLRWTNDDINTWRQNLHKVFLASPYENAVSTVISDNYYKEKNCNYYCGAGRGLWAIDINGNLNFCHHFSNDKTIPSFSGHLSPEKLFQKIIHSTFPPNPKLITEKCLNCKIFSYCSGGCWSNAYYQNGQTFQPHETECRLRKASYKIVDLDRLLSKECSHHSKSACPSCKFMDCDESGDMCNASCYAPRPINSIPIKQESFILE